MALNARQDGPRDPDRDPVLDRLYGSAPSEEPPARLDAAILAAARRQAGSRPRALRSALRYWRVPVSIAAVLVLSASLVMLMKEEGADRVYEGPPAETQPQPLPQAKPDASAGDAVQPQSEAARRQTGSAREHDARRRLEAPAQAAGAPAEAEATKRKAEERRDDMSRQVEGMLSKVQPSAIPPATAPEEPKAQAAAPRAFQERSATEEGAAIRDYPGARSPAPAAPPARPLGEAAAKRAEPEMNTGQLLDRSSDAAARSKLTEPTPAAKPFAQPKMRVAPKAGEPVAGAFVPPAPVWSGFERQPPERWITRIEDLQHTGRAADARDMLEEFRRRFPDYPVPASLSR